LAHFVKNFVYGSIEVPFLSTMSDVKSLPQLNISAANFRPQSKLHMLGTEPTQIRSVGSIVTKMLLWQRFVGSQSEPAAALHSTFALRARH